MKVLTIDDVTIGQELPPLEVEVTPRVVIMGASSSRDWQPQHHDHAWAVEKVGTRGIFLNTPNIAGWIERYLTDWTGPMGRLARLSFRMRRSICAGDTMVINGVVTDEIGDAHPDNHYAQVAVTITVDGETAVECRAKISLPTIPDDAAGSPWYFTGDGWNP